MKAVVFSTILALALIAPAAPSLAQAPADESAPPAAADAAPAVEDAPLEDANPAQKRAAQLDQLYIRLAASSDATETSALVADIDRLHLQTDSPASALLMSRAIETMQASNYETSGKLLDTIVQLQPQWAEAWNKRATLRYMAGNAEGSMADIAQTLKLEPRHIGALGGMGMILEQSGLRDAALRAYEKSLEIAPQLASAKQSAIRLKAALARERL